MENKLMYIGGEFWLSFQFLRELDISEKTFEKWKQKGAGVIRDKRVSYVRFNDIPQQTKSKLPTENELAALFNGNIRDNQIQSIWEKLKYAQVNKFSQYRAYYRDTYQLDSERASECAMKRAVWERVMELYFEHHSQNYGGGLKKGSLEVIFAAYKRLYPTQYSLKHAFLRTINLCKEAGFDTIIIDKRKLKNGKNLKFNEIHQCFIGGLMSIGKAYTAPDILRLITPMCNKANVPIPSLSWIKSYLKDHTSPTEYITRYGADKFKKTLPYSSMEVASQADMQWQLDGWNLPFYFKNEANKLDKLTLITVRDAYSRKIIGYSIDRTENRLTILEAFQDAVSNVGGLPLEIVVDNHSFNRTKEAENFISQIQKVGVAWTVTENPQYKSITERYFKILGEQYCKEHYGYIGQGIKSREKNAHTTDELKGEFGKAGKVLSEDEVKLIGIYVVKQFNTTYNVNQLNKTPEQLYTESEKQARYPIDLQEQLRIFINRSEHKISRGQINITIAGKKYEYQVNAETFNRYNGKTVGVRYESLDLIYLFDLKTDMAIGSVKQKSKIHGALAERTDEDLQKLLENAGRLKGITTQSRKTREEIVEKAISINPDVLEILHHYTTPKDVLKAAEIDQELKWEAAKRGVNLSIVSPVTRTTEITNPVYLNKKRSKREDSPFTPANHVISVFEPGTDDYNE